MKLSHALRAVYVSLAGRIQSPFVVDLLKLFAKCIWWHISCASFFFRMTYECGEKKNKTDEKMEGFLTKADKSKIFRKTNDDDDDDDDYDDDDGGFVNENIFSLTSQRKNQNASNKCLT